jgi:beta-lactamase superfamily II metal-dependent hydrolase
VTCKLTFLSVGNADSIVIQDDISLILVDLGNLNILEEWLQEHKISSIDRIYITHAHADHFPSLIRLVDFLGTWFKHGTIEKLHLPYRIIEIARKKILSDRNNPKHQRLELAMNRMTEWSKECAIKLSPIVQYGEEYSEGSLKIKALHPSQDYIENHLALTDGKLNEISIVLQVMYGNFSALLLADIEGAGLAEFASSLKINSEHTKFPVNAVKIPHHGAYPANGDDLKDLLTLINAEIAILSVGSKNTYGHVEPQLFKTLIELSEAQHLKQFICTEVTRTCAHSSSDRSTMGKKGLSVAEKCAGEITIIADTSGSWKLQVETPDHPSKVSSLAHAACIGRAELD